MNPPCSDPCCIALPYRTGRLHPPGAPFGDASPAIRWQTGRPGKESGIATDGRTNGAIACSGAAAVPGWYDGPHRAMVPEE
ncbi:MAG TPA: hypothetical protein ENN85_00635 [Methanoculleus sp.]|nr:hypothetical protein [Methanoculleus sp.]